jgi:catechol 2,3-dioxygenase-like lactoylglutathione lyase family enzyme
MFDHVTIRVSDRPASRRFYETVLGEPTHAGEAFDEWGNFSIATADDEHRVTRHLHVGFVAESRGEVDAFWRRGVEAGYRSDGEPGLRPQYHPNYYGSFLLDTDGNSAEACTGFRTGGDSRIDHVWLGVRDLEESRRFWETIAPVLGLGLRDRREQQRFHVYGSDRSFALVADGRPPTAHLHLAFPASDDETVAEFHRVATAAGYRDNGAPGERPQYHPGYVGAFVLDPDGNNVEAVNHNR